MPESTTTTAHDWRNHETCECGERGCASYRSHANREQSTLDAIDELIDEQLDAGEPRAGYAYGDPHYPKCPHCDRDFHGLAITENLEHMRIRGQLAAGYDYATDTSRVLCPGSRFIGPIPPPAHFRPFAEQRIAGTVRLNEGTVQAFPDNIAVGMRVGVEIDGQMHIGVVTRHEEDPDHPGGWITELDNQPATDCGLQATAGVVADPMRRILDLVENLTHAALAMAMGSTAAGDAVRRMHEALHRRDA